TPAQPEDQDQSEYKDDSDKRRGDRGDLTDGQHDGRQEIRRKPEADHDDGRRDNGVAVFHQRTEPLPRVLCSAASVPAEISPHALAAIHSLPDRLEPFLLASPGIEVTGFQPLFQRLAGHRPVAVEHGIPRRVAIFALDDHVLAEDALETEAEALGRALRARIGGVAFPLETAIAEFVEDMPRE